MSCAANWQYASITIDKQVILRIEYLLKNTWFHIMTNKITIKLRLLIMKESDIGLKITVVPRVF